MPNASHSTLKKKSHPSEDVWGQTQGMEVRDTIVLSVPPIGPSDEPEDGGDSGSRGRTWGLGKPHGKSSHRLLVCQTKCEGSDGQDP